VKLLNALSLVGALAIGATLVGCLNDSPARPADAQLIVNAGVRDVNKTKALGKTSVITLNKLIITLISSDSTDAVRRDTVLADTGASFSSDATDDQILTRNFRVTPLRSWTVVVKTLDVNDSVVHYDSQLVSNLLIGETRPVTVNLTSRFVMYEARFSLPDSLVFTQLDSLKQQLVVDRMVMIVDGDTVIDSTRTPRFETSPTEHSVFFDYISVTDTPDVTIEFHGRVGADTGSSKLFEYVFEDVDPTDENPDPVPGVYTGPNANELGAITGLTINIGKVGTVVFQPVINPNVTKKAVK
jgi:hypothetical protein